MPVYMVSGGPIHIGATFIIGGLGVLMNRRTGVARVLLGEFGLAKGPDNHPTIPKYPHLG